MSPEDELKPPDQKTAPQGPEEEFRRGKSKFEHKDPRLNLKEKVNFRIVQVFEDSTMATLYESQYADARIC